MPSIRQNTIPETLPDFRNLGLMARALVAANLLYEMLCVLPGVQYRA